MKYTFGEVYKNDVREVEKVRESNQRRYKLGRKKSGRTKGQPG